MYDVPQFWKERGPLYFSETGGTRGVPKKIWESPGNLQLKQSDFCRNVLQCYYRLDELDSLTDTYYNRGNISLIRLFVNSDVPVQFKNKLFLTYNTVRYSTVLILYDSLIYVLNTRLSAQRLGIHIISGRIIAEYLLKNLYFDTWDSTPHFTLELAPLSTFHCVQLPKHP